MQKIIKFIFLALAVSIVLQKASAVTYVASDPIVFEGSYLTAYPNGQVLCVKNEKGPDGRPQRSLLLYDRRGEKEIELEIPPSWGEESCQLSPNGQILCVRDDYDYALLLYEKEGEKWNKEVKKKLFFSEVDHLKHYKLFQDGQTLACVTRESDLSIHRKIDHSWVQEYNFDVTFYMRRILHCVLSKNSQRLLIYDGNGFYLYDQKNKWDQEIRLLSLSAWDTFDLIDISCFDVSQDGHSLIIAPKYGCVQLYEKRESWEQNSDFAMNRVAEAFFCQNDMLAIKYRDNTLSFYAKENDRWNPEPQFSINKNIEFHSISENEQVLGIAADGKIAIYKKLENNIELFYECENRTTELKSLIVFDDASFITTQQGENNETIVTSYFSSCC